MFSWYFCKTPLFVWLSPFLFLSVRLMYLSVNRVWITERLSFSYLKVCFVIRERDLRVECCVVVILLTIRKIIIRVIYFYLRNVRFHNKWTTFISYKCKSCSLLHTGLCNIIPVHAQNLHGVDQIVGKVGKHLSFWCTNEYTWSRLQVLLFRLCKFVSKW